MPKCKNNSKRSYKGNEPSPKGLGYCAHTMKEGSKKIGKDGNKWIVKILLYAKKGFTSRMSNMQKALGNETNIHYYSNLLTRYV